MARYASANHYRKHADTALEHYVTTSALSVVTIFFRSPFSNQSTAVQTQRPVFVQLLLIVFRLSQCAWLSASQRHNVESCVRTLSDMARSRSITIPSDLGNKVGSKVTQLNPRRDGRIRSVILRSPTGNCSNYAVKTLYPLETQISLRVKKRGSLKKGEKWIHQRRSSLEKWIAKSSARRKQEVEKWETPMYTAAFVRRQGITLQRCKAKER